MRNKHLVEAHIRWKLNSGNFFFWWDNWLGTGALGNHNSNVSSLNNSRVSQFLVNGEWNDNMVRQQVPPLLIPQILQTRFDYQEGVPDDAIWEPTDSGMFTYASAWSTIKQKKSKTMVNTLCWHKNIPFKISFLLWRALRGKLSTNDKLISFGVDPVKCFCCRNSGWDNIDHIFVSRQFSRYIWKGFSKLFGITHDHTHLRNVLMN